MSDVIKFYTNPQSRGRIVRWMLEEVGAPYETEILEYGGSMKQQPFLDINPMGKVPAIEHHGTVVTESAAICAYLADAFPDADLAPATADRGEYYRWLFFASGPLESAIVNRALQVEVAQDKQAMVGYGSFDTVMTTLDKHLTDREFVCAEKFTAADVYFGSQIGFGLQFGSIEKRSSFETYWQKVSDREAYRRAGELDDADVADNQPN